MNKTNSPRNRELPFYLSPAPKAPIGGLMDPRFVYVPAAATNVAKTFERVRAEMAQKGK